MFPMIGQHFVDGLLTGAVVSLGAIGLTLTLKILRFANFAHSELLTFGAYAALVFYTFFGAVEGLSEPSFGALSFNWALVIATFFAAGSTVLVALAIDRFIYSRLRHRAGEMTLVFASFGVALLLRHSLLLVFGHNPRYYSNDIQMSIVVGSGIRVQPDQLFVLGLTIVLVLILHCYLQYSRGGVAMRAVSENPSLASVNGVDVTSVMRLTWIVGASLAAVAGVLYGLTVQIRPELGFNLILPLFAAAILGGTGSVFGAVIGGLIVGVAENMAVMIIPTGYKPAVPFLLILLILLFRPAGLFGERR